MDGNSNASEQAVYCECKGGSHGKCHEPPEGWTAGPDENILLVTCPEHDVSERQGDRYLRGVEQHLRR